MLLGSNLSTQLSIMWGCPMLCVVKKEKGQSVSLYFYCRKIYDLISVLLNYKLTIGIHGGSIWEIWSSLRGPLNVTRSVSLSHPKVFTGSHFVPQEVSWGTSVCLFFCQTGSFRSLSPPWTSEHFLDTRRFGESSQTGGLGQIVSQIHGLRRRAHLHITVLS